MRNDRELSVTVARQTAGITLGAAMVAMGLIAGVYYAFECAVMVGLRQMDDRTFILVMQRINVVIVNPVFVSSFLGAFVLTALAAVQHRRLRQHGTTRWIGAALVLYSITLGVTIGVNLPLNDTLGKARNTEDRIGLATVRQRFEAPWRVGNTVRAVVAILALACLGRALVEHGKSGADRNEP